MQVIISSGTYLAYMMSHQIGHAKVASIKAEGS